MATTVPEAQPPGADDSLEPELEALGQNFYVEMNGIVRGSRVQVPVTTELIGVNLQLVLDAQVFKDWVEAVDKDDILFINGVEVQSIDMFGPRVGFIKFKADAVINIGGEEGAVMVPGIVFMRGGAVGILVILECDGREYTILTYQARVPVGCHNLPEVPAGMLDGSGNFKGVAADEIAEECDITISEDELVDLTELAYQGKWKGMLPSAGGCDEFLRLYVCRRQVEPGVITELEGRLTGLREEGERIKLHIVPLEEAWRISPDSKLLSCLALYDRLKQSGELLDSPINVAPSSVHELARTARVASVVDEGEAVGSAPQKKLGDAASVDSMLRSTDSSSSSMSSSMLRSRDSDSPTEFSRTTSGVSSADGRHKGRLANSKSTRDQKAVMKQLHNKIGALQTQLMTKDSRVRELETVCSMDGRMVAEIDRLSSENERLNAENTRLLAQLQAAADSNN